MYSSLFIHFSLFSHLTCSCFSNEISSISHLAGDSAVHWGGGGGGGGGGGCAGLKLILL